MPLLSQMLREAMEAIPPFDPESFKARNKLLQKLKDRLVYYLVTVRRIFQPNRVQRDDISILESEAENVEYLFNMIEDTIASIVQARRQHEGFDIATKHDDLLHLVLENIRLGLNGVHRQIRRVLLVGHVPNPQLNIERGVLEYNGIGIPNNRVNLHPDARLVANWGELSHPYLLNHKDRDPDLNDHLENGRILLSDGTFHTGGIFFPIKETLEFVNCYFNHHCAIHYTY